MLMNFENGLLNIIQKNGAINDTQLLHTVINTETSVVPCFKGKAKDIDTADILNVKFTMKF